MLLALAQQKQHQCPLSKILSQTRQCFTMHKAAKLWFTPLFSLAQQVDPTKITSDIEKKEYYQLLRMLNFVVADLLGFYRNVPEDAYKLLHLIKGVFGLGGKQPAYDGFHTLTSQVYFNSTLALLLLKNRQYSFVYECYQSIVSLIQSDKMDPNSDIFLVAISNYVTFVRTHQSMQMRGKLTELVELLRGIYRKLLDRYLVGCAEANVRIMQGVLKQQEVYLGMEFKAQTGLLVKKFEQKEKQQSGNDNSLLVNRSRSLEHPNNKYKSTTIQLKRQQLYFFASSMAFLNKSQRFPQKQHNSLQLIPSEISILPSMHHRTVDHDGMDFLTGLNGGSSATPRSHNTIDAGRFQSMEIKATLNKSKVEKKQETKAAEIIKRKKIWNSTESICLKINYSMLQIISDGIIVSDYLKQRKKFITWSQIFFLLKNLRFCFIFSQIMPISTYYDIGRILSFYIYRNSSQKEQQGALILDCPKELVEINMFTKLYLVDGRHMKLFMMNQYDIEHIELSVDCFIAEFQELFKCVTKNQYVLALNDKIFNKEVQSQHQASYSMEVWKKRNETTAEQLSNQIKTQQLLEISFVKSSPFKIFLVMPRNVQLLLYVREKDLKQLQSNYLPMTIINLEQKDSEKRELKLKVPFYKINRYFPAEPADISGWLKKFGKYILEGYMKCFLDFPSSFYNLQFFDAITYAKKIQMTPSGKYVTPVIAELIGSSTKIWGICIRLFQQSFVKEVVTFIYNPYPELLLPAIGKSPQERKKLLISLLFESSVAATHKKLHDKRLAGTMVNLITYWSIIQF